MQVSVIVPVYNAEKTLRRCLRSIRGQTWKKLEVIVVNDGSTDGSLDIIREYCGLDPRFQLVDKENTGVSDSRNQGLRLAGGDWIQFVDSDDWIPANATELLVSAAVRYGADMAIGDYIRVNHSAPAEKGHIPREGRITRAEYAAYMMQAPANFYYGVMWNKLYRADVVREQGLVCSDELNWCEDFRFNLEYLRYIQTVAVVFQPVYYYVKRKGSLVDTQVDFATTVKTKRVLFQYYKELYDALDMYEDHKLRIQSFYLEFARDMERRPVREERKAAVRLYRKENGKDRETLVRFEQLLGLSDSRDEGARPSGERKTGETETAEAGGAVSGEPGQA